MERDIVRDSLYQLVDSRYKRVGLLGGSFNPAHSGHVHISFEAIKLLDLDCIIWLVSPQNPMKPLMRSTLNKRTRYAKLIASDKRIIVSDIEKLFKTCYTSDTITMLQKSFPDIRFTWIIGADNMIQIHQWHNWKSIFDSLFVAVFDRAEYAKEVMESEASKCYNEVPVSVSHEHYDLAPGFWKFFRICKSPLSSTFLRNINNNAIDLYKESKAMKVSADHIKDIILSSLDHDRGEDIKVYDISKKSSFAQYMMITSGQSNRHVRSIIENLMAKLKKADVKSVAFGMESANWILLDVGDIVVNVFLPEYRELYNLEEIWG